MGRKFGFSFSWRRALGLSAAKGKVSQAIGIPLTQSGRERKAGRLLGNVVGGAFIAGTELANRFNSASAPQPVDSTLSQDATRQRELNDYYHRKTVLKYVREREDHNDYENDYFPEWYHPPAPEKRGRRGPISITEIAHEIGEGLYDEVLSEEAMLARVSVIVDRLKSEGLVEELNPGVVQATAGDREPTLQRSSSSASIPPVSDSLPIEHYWLLIRSVRLGDTLEDLAKRNPDLTSVQDDQLGLGVTGLTDSRGLTVLAFRGTVYSINVSFAWGMTLEDLISAAAPYFCATGATPIDESPNLSGWLSGDEVFLANLTDGIASIVLGTFSVMNEVNNLLEQALGQPVDPLS
jgi:hypothetical protein